MSYNIRAFSQFHLFNPHTCFSELSKIKVSTHLLLQFLVNSGIALKSTETIIFLCKTSFLTKFYHKIWLESISSAFQYFTTLDICLIFLSCLLWFLSIWVSWLIGGESKCGKAQKWRECRKVLKLDQIWIDMVRAWYPLCRGEQGWLNYSWLLFNSLKQGAKIKK